MLARDHLHSIITCSLKVEEEEKGEEEEEEEEED